MVEIAGIDVHVLENAVELWTGFGIAAAPNRNERRVSDRLGLEAAAQLLPVVRELEADFYQTQARFVAEDLREMAEIAKDDFKRTYPSLTAGLADALAWCYTFDYK